MSIPFGREYAAGEAQATFEAAPGFVENWRRQTRQLRQEAYLFYFVLRQPRTSWKVRLIAGFCTAYIFSPVQIIPNFIPVVGFLDDALVLLLGAKLVQRMTPADQLAECVALAAAFDARRKEETRSRFARLGVVLVATSWLLATAVASALVAAYVYR